MEPSIFTRIINGDIPCHKVYEDEQTLAFMDIHPIQPGMVLVIPKRQIDNFEDLPDELLQAVMLTTKKIMLSLRRVFPDKKKIGLQIEGLDVPHAHVKIFPVNTGAEFHAYASETDPNHNELEQLAVKIRSHI
jgi:histidine triad (HIT) family protein